VPFKLILAQTASLLFNDPSQCERLAASLLLLSAEAYLLDGIREELDQLSFAFEQYHQDLHTEDELEQILRSVLEPYLAYKKLLGYLL
jgi:hypothetical protein